MRLLYAYGLIHGDLSSFNILNYHEQPVLIDFSQGTTVKTPNSEELLRRDVTNIVQFFAKLKIRASVDELLKTIKTPLTSD